MADQNTILHPIEAGRVQENINLYPKTTIDQVLELNDTLDDKQDKFADVTISGSGDNKTTTITSVEHNLIISGDVPEESDGGAVTIRTDHGGAIHFNSTDISTMDMTTDSISISGPYLGVNTGGVSISSGDDISISTGEDISLSALNGDISLSASETSQINMNDSNISISGPELTVYTGEVSIDSGGDISLGAADSISISTGGDIDLTPAGRALYNNNEIATKDDTTPKEYTFNITLDTSSDHTIYDTQMHLNPSRPLYIQMFESSPLDMGFSNSMSLVPFPTTSSDIITVFVSKLGGFASSMYQSGDGNYIMWLNSVDLSKTLELYFSNYSPEPDPVIVKIIN